jgi:hypothetical protein
MPWPNWAVKRTPTLAMASPFSWPVLVPYVPAVLQRRLPLALAVMTEFTPFQQHVIERVLQTPAPGKHAARSAMRHLERAFELAESMPEVAIFLGITAEEESATAVFIAMQRRKYLHSDQIQIHNHVHKTALHPFLLAVGQAIKEFSESRNPKFLFDKEESPNGRELLRVRFDICDNTGKLWHAMPLPALNFSISLDGESHEFSSELASVASTHSTKDISTYVKNLANRRNKVLYAASNGIPHATDSKSFLEYRKSVIVSHLMAYLLIDQHAEQQLFVQQSLDAFLTMLGRLPR